MTGSCRPKTVLFVFGWLVVGGEETEVRLLAANIDRSRYKIDVVACLHKDGMPAQTHEQGVNQRTVVVEWESLAKAIEVHDGPAYQAALKVLGDSVERDFRIVEGP